MPLLIHSCMLVPLVGSVFLFGCSQSGPAPSYSSSKQSTAMPAADSRSGVPAQTMPADGPCHVLADAEVTEVFSGATPGEREDSLEKYGISTCVWNLPSDRFVVQVLNTGAGSVMDELRSRASGSIDPTMPAAMERVRFETVVGIGDEAIAVVEQADPGRGILADMAVLVIQRGERRAVLFTGSSLAGGERASGLKSLETLGRSAANRL